MNKRKTRPWHLIPKELRESAIRNLEFDAGDSLCECNGPFGIQPKKCKSNCAERSEMFRAAAQALRDLALYPDEALVYSVPRFDELIELIDVPSRVTPPHCVVTWDGARPWFRGIDFLVPLTPAAAEFLYELKAGMR